MTRSDDGRPDEAAQQDAALADEEVDGLAGGRLLGPAEVPFGNQII
jgi:hypothetical protein